MTDSNESFIMFTPGKPIDNMNSAFIKKKINSLNSELNLLVSWEFTMWKYYTSSRVHYFVNSKLGKIHSSIRGIWLFPKGFYVRNPDKIYSFLKTFFCKSPLYVDWGNLEVMWHRVMDNCSGLSFKELMFYKVVIELVNTEPLLLGEIQG